MLSPVYSDPSLDRVIKQNTPRHRLYCLGCRNERDFACMYWIVTKVRVFQLCEEKEKIIHEEESIRFIGLESLIILG